GTAPAPGTGSCRPPPAWRVCWPPSRPSASGMTAATAPADRALPGREAVPVDGLLAAAREAASRDAWPGAGSRPHRAWRFDSGPAVPASWKRLPVQSLGGKWTYFAVDRAQLRRDSRDKVPGPGDDPRARSVVPVPALSGWVH